MGNGVSTSDCFLWAQLPPEKFAELLAEEFTVIRTSGEQQTGWRIPSASHLCHEGKWEKYHAHVWDNTANGKGEKKWRFHMVLDAPDQVHCCGWRHQRTFWPTRLTTEEEKEAWWAGIDVLLATLKRTREMPDAELMPLLDAQQEREAEVKRKYAEAYPERRMAHEAWQDEAIALEPEMAIRREFWRDFEAQLAKLKEELKKLTQQAANNPELQEELAAFAALHGADDRQLADKLQKRMLQQKADKERQATLRERERMWRELDAVEQNAVAHKDYTAAERAKSQKQTAQECWAEEDAKKA